MKGYVMTILKRKQKALADMRREIAALTQKIFRNPNDKRAYYWEERLFRLIGLIPEKERHIKVLMGFVDKRAVLVRRRELVPGEWFPNQIDIQALLVPTVAVAAAKDNNGGFVLFSSPMDPKKIRSELKSRPKNPLLRDLLIIYHSHEADPRCQCCLHGEKMKGTNLCKGCGERYLSAAIPQ